MTACNFDEALRLVLREEGGYTDHPRDPGGPTNFGITIADARRYWKTNATAADVKAMPLDVAKDIYRLRYWNATRCDQLPGGLDYCIFDYGVNSGVSRAAKVLRRVLRLPDAASFDDVLKALRSADGSMIVDAICDERLRFLQSLNTWPVFGRGWEARVGRVRAAALAMARRSTEDSAARQTHAADKPKPPSKEIIRSATIGGAAASGGLLAGKAGVDPNIVVVVVIAAVCLGVGVYLLVKWRRTRQAKA